jgi:predicted dehydrogenase
MLKIVFVGAGWFANHVHGPALARYAEEHPGEVDLAAVCVRKNVDRAQDFCEKFGFSRVYTDLEEMLDKEQPGACWVVTPIDATRRVAGRVMERRVPVFLEKPPGANLQEAQELAAISQRAGTPNMVAFNRRWAPSTRKALEWAREIGPVEHIYARMLRPQRMDRTFAFGTGIHLLDCVRSLGEATVGGLTESRTVRWRSAAGDASPATEAPANPGAESPTDVYNFHVDMVFESGARARCDILPACGMLEESYILFGAKKSVSYCLPWSAGSVELDGGAEVWSEGEVRASEKWSFDPHDVSGGFYGEACEFLSALTEGRRPSPSAEESVASVALAAAVQEGRDIEF